MESSKEMQVVQPAELDNIYRSGKISPEVRKTFPTALEKGLSGEGTSIDQYIETNRRLKMEMKEYLDKYKTQRSMMQSVIYYLRNPNYATVRFADKVGGLFGRKTQLEAKKIANDPTAIRRLFEEMVLSIEQSRSKTLELEQQAKALYNAALYQREVIDKDITDLLQKISINKDRLIKLEEDYNRVNGSMDKLLLYMGEIGIVVKGGRPVLDEKPDVNLLKGVDDIKQDNSYEARLDNLLNKGKIEGSPEVKSETINEKVEEKVEEKTEEKSEEIKAGENVEKLKEERKLDKKKIEAIKVYHAINNEIVKVENLLRDANNEKLVLHQNYERAKENLVLYERVLITQVNEARNYFAMLFAIYDAEVKYTLPSARLIANLASLQEVASQLAQQLYDARNIFNNLIDNVTAGALEIQEGIQTLALNPSWDPEKIDQAENRTIELAKRTKEFTLEMDKKLTEIETVYKSPAIQGKIKDKALLESGVEDDYLKKLLTEGKPL